MFTLGSDGQTVVKELEEFTDDTNLQIMKNVAIGSGVILLCVAVSIVSGGAGAPAACAIFAASAKTGAIMALSGSVFGGVSAGIVKGIQTHPALVQTSYFQAPTQQLNGKSVVRLFYDRGINLVA